MAELIWTEESERWLKDIYDYIALDNPDAAPAGCARRSGGTAAETHAG